MTDCLDLDTILAQQKASRAWMAELPEPKRMTYHELHRMIIDKVGMTDPDSLAEQIMTLRDRLGVVVDYSDDEDDEESEDDSEESEDDSEESENDDDLSD